jgi:hypothetical protein
MKNLTFHIFVAFLLGSLPIGELVSAKDEKLKPEQLVQKHLASIGTTEALAAVRTRGMSGTAQVVFRLGSTGQVNGKSTLLSDGKKVRIGMVFPALEYPGEQLAYDGNRVTVGQVRPGQRSNLSGFVYQYDMLLKEGLLGGTTTTAWALLSTSERQPKLNYSGVKKYEGRQLHELKYRAKKGGSDLNVSLYFDPETFRHVNTQIRLIQPAIMASNPADSAGQRDTIYTIVEHFGDFKEVDSLNLPHSYKIVLTIEGQRQTILYEWNLTFDQAAHNQEFDPSLFTTQ